MGSVYKARHLMLDKIVCIKVLSSALSRDERYIQFFLREARSVAKLDHPNIVQVFNAGIEKHLHFLVMSYVDGKPFSDVIKHDGPLAPAEALRIMRGVLEGLASAHAQGIVHRDIKPSNILIASDGTPKILDFGLARTVNEEKQLTVAGEMVGTAYFMAPEQGLGDKVDNRADLYSLGVTWFYALTGKYPYEGKNAVEVIHRHITVPTPSLLSVRPDIPPWMAAVVQKLMAKKPDDRFQSARDVLSACSDTSASPASIHLPTLEITNGFSQIALGGADVLPIGQGAPNPASGSFPMPSMRFEIPPQAQTPEQASAAQVAAPMEWDTIAHSPQITTQPEIPITTETSSAATTQTSIRIKLKTPAPAPGPASAAPYAARSAGTIWKPVLIAILYAAVMVLLSVVASMLGVFASASSPSYIDYLSVWQKMPYTQPQLMLAAVGVVVFLTALFWNFMRVGLTGVVAVMAIALFSYLAAFGAGIHYLPSVAGSTNLLWDKLTLAGKPANFFVFMVPLYFYAASMLSSRRSRLLNFFGFIFACAGSVLNLVFVSNSVGVQAGSGMPVFGMAAVALLALAVFSGFFKNSMIFSLLPPSLLLFASGLMVWAYPCSFAVAREVSRLDTRQEEVIQQATARRAEQEALAERIKARQLEVLAKTGDMSQAPVEEIKPVEIPQRVPLDQLRKYAWKNMVMQPLHVFFDSASANGSFLLISLIMIFVMTFYYFNCLRGVSIR